MLELESQYELLISVHTFSVFMQELDMQFLPLVLSLVGDLALDLMFKVTVPNW